MRKDIALGQIAARLLPKPIKQGRTRHFSGWNEVKTNVISRGFASLGIRFFLLVVVKDLEVELGKCHVRGSCHAGERTILVLMQSIPFSDNG